MQLDRARSFPRCIFVRKLSRGVTIAAVDRHVRRAGRLRHENALANTFALAMAKDSFAQATGARRPRPYDRWIVRWNGAATSKRVRDRSVVNRALADRAARVAANLPKIYRAPRQGQGSGVH
jgi:hypothetical protein